MYGAILGDMVGAPFEFDRGEKTKEFRLFTEKSTLTDDTVMTIAVADALLGVSAENTEEEIREAVVASMQAWGRKYPDAGYGVRFFEWLWKDNPQPYQSWGNGSAMRVSAAGWLYESLEETRRIACLTAEVTHNHPEGIKGAEAVAGAIYLARTGSSKEEIRDYILREFGYDLSRTCAEIRPFYRHVESCQETVPEAITAFLEGKNFEDVIRTAVSLGGDCDTLTCIAGSIAEAFYGVPVALEAECKIRLPEEMNEVLCRFDERRNRKPAFSDSSLEGNRMLEAVIETYYMETDRAALTSVLEVLRRRMHEDGHFLVPVIPVNNPLESLDLTQVKVGDTVTAQEDLRFRMHHLETKDDRNWLAAFTSYAEYEKGEPVSLLSVRMEEFLHNCSGMSEDGIVINPWGEHSFLLTKDLIRILLKADRIVTEHQRRNGPACMAGKGEV